MAEFGSSRANAGGGKLDKFNRLDPTLSTMQKYFPQINLVMYTDFDMKVKNAIIKKVKPIYNIKEKRYGNRCNDYYKVLGLLESEADIAICMDSDMLIYSKDIEALIALTKKFGICIPANPRMIVKIDGIKGADSDYKIGEDETLGNGFAYNMSPISLCTKNERARQLLKAYCKEMEDHVVRGPLAMWRAVWKTGINPYLLPFQWCVCREHIDIKNEIILHVGHEDVRRHYEKKNR